MELKDLYRDVILDHNRQPRNFGRLDPADATADGHNPLCGDRLTVTLRLTGDKITDIRFEGKGCAISTASASLMSEAVKGRDRTAVRELFDHIHALLTQADAPVDESLGKLAALSGVREFPSRVKCASLCWHTLNAALERGGTISTEAGNESSSEVLR
jgi:nitrogen fixation NifU-like protein